MWEKRSSSLMTMYLLFSWKTLHINHAVEQTIDFFFGKFQYLWNKTLFSKLCAQSSKQQMLWKSNFNPLSDVFKCLKFKVCFLARFFSCKPLENQSNPFDGRKNQIMWKNAQTGKMQICWFFTVTFNQTGTVPQYSTYFK